MERRTKNDQRETKRLTLEGEKENCGIFKVWEEKMNDDLDYLDDDEEYLTPSGETPDVALLRYDLLRNIIILSRREYDKRDGLEAAKGLFERAYQSLECGFDDLYFLLVAAATGKMYEAKGLDSEYRYQGLFKKHASEINEDWEIEERKGDLHNVPDAFVRDKRTGELLPVEVKRHYFNQRALNQLNRYIAAFGCKRGIAVGESATIDLPRNVIFIPHDVLRELEGELKKEALE